VPVGLRQPVFQGGQSLPLQRLGTAAGWGGPAGEPIKPGIQPPPTDQRHRPRHADLGQMHTGIRAIPDQRPTSGSQPAGDDLDGLHGPIHRRLMATPHRRIRPRGWGKPR
jgi:hypothetical protein